jgi:hypothetical protein
MLAFEGDKRIARRWKPAMRHGMDVFAESVSLARAIRALSR